MDVSTAGGARRTRRPPRRGRRLARALAVCLALAGAPDAAALDLVDRYSPRDAARPARKQTQYIVLHTTEGGTAGSLDKLRRNGEAHYLVEPGGRIYRIIRNHKVAFHAGRSMWNGRVNIDDVSIGIEVVGYHNRSITAAQSGALRELLDILQQRYGIRDDHVLTHSMVAYGTPDRWHSRSHRGRKRCGMQFAKTTVRGQLGLGRGPTFDPDVRAGRLVNADPYLARVLYGSANEQSEAEKRFTAKDADLIAPGRSAWDIARDQYASSRTTYLFPDGTRRQGDQIADWNRMPPGTRVVLGEDDDENAPETGVRVASGGAARDLAGDEQDKESTIYFLPDGRVRPGSEMDAAALAALPAGTKVLVGYVFGGHVTAKRRAFDICGTKWNDASTLYRLADGTFVAGSQLSETAIPSDCMLFFRR